MHITEYDNMYSIDQDFYMSKIEQIPSKAELCKFVSTRMKLVSLANTRPNIVLENSQIAQVTRAMYEKDMITHCKLLNKEIEYVYDYKASIRIPKLDYSSLRLTVHSDAVFSNNVDLSSQLGLIILLSVNNHNAIQIS